MLKKIVTLGTLLSLSACGGAKPHSNPAPTPPAALADGAAAALKQKSGLAKSYPEVKYPTPTKVIHLTFDDGPSRYTPKILQILNNEHVPATFFIIGRQVPLFPKAIKEEKESNMSLQVHTWDHIHTFPSLSLQGISKQVKRTSQVIQKYSGEYPTCVRPPDGATSGTVRRYLNKSGYSQILWDVDTEDWRRPGVKSITNTAITQAHDGDIILMHDGGGNRSQDIAALPEIIHTLKARGYSFQPLCTGGKVKNLPW